MNKKNLSSEILKYSNPEKAKIYQRFFKTGKGQYGEGDVFLGLTVPQSRKIAKQFLDINLDEIGKHLTSEFHEERLIALLILVEKYKKENDKKKIFDFYLDNTRNINNWDLVDLSAPNIIGDFLYHFGKDYPVYRVLLKKLAESTNLWEKRIAVVSTFAFIRQNEFDEILKISKMLLSDKHDLIHKAIGWMLREVGKRDEQVLKKFLKENYDNIPRTTLRYSIERFNEKERLKFLKGDF